MVHIGDRANSSFKVSIKIDKIGTTYFTVSANATSNQGAITEYIFVVDGVEKAPITQNTYTEENLEKVSKHKVKVIAVDEKGNRKESREITLTTEDRMYLYNQGEECVSITGGWVETFTISRYNGSSIGKYPVIRSQNYIDLDLVNTSSWVYTEINTSQKINTKGFEILKLEYDNTSRPYEAQVCLTNELTLSDIVYGKRNDNTILKEQGLNIPIGQNYITEVDISQIEECYITIYSARGVSADSRGNVRLKNVWLEK